MSKLNFETFTIVTHEVQWYDLDSFLSEYFGKPFEFVPNEEPGGPSTIYDLEKQDQKAAEWARKDAEEFKETGKGAWKTRSLLQHLVNKKVLPAGRWVVNVEW